jgi:hypothetical protein
MPHFASPPVNVYGYSPFGYPYSMTPETYGYAISANAYYQSGYGGYGGYGGYRGYGGQGGIYYPKRPRDHTVRDKVNAVHSEHPEISSAALATIGTAINAQRKHGEEGLADPHAIEILHKRLVRRFGEKETDEALQAMGVTTADGSPKVSGKHETTGYRHSAYATSDMARSQSMHATSDMAHSHDGHATSDMARGRKSPKKIKKAEKADGAKTAPHAEASAGSFIGSIVGMLGAGYLGYQLMNIFGGGFSVIGTVAVAMLAVVGATVGGSTGTMVSNFLTPKPDMALAKAPAPAIKPAAPEKDAGEQKKIAEAAKQFHEAPVRQPEPSSHDVSSITLPQTLPAPTSSTRKR